MIQDIAPHHFDNQYHPVRQRRTMEYCFIAKDACTCRRMVIPAVRELCGEDRDRLHLLFDR
ncbi:MAG: hypothetical protein ACLVJ6_00200 [Merdibacter sp.]